ncbi:hypothetical protein ACLBV5_09660 [Brevundimonas sp. M1A4_2e]
MGDKWHFESVCRPMQAAQANPVITALLDGLSEKLIAEIPQPGFEIGNPGNPTVASAGQSGSSVTMTGFAPGYQIRNGQFFSIVANGVRYLHRARADVTANGSGAAVVPMRPMLKVSPPAGSVCEFASPKIEGFVEGNEQGWTVGLVANVGLTFKIIEAQ